jgi:hypothetical protein
MKFDWSDVPQPKWNSHSSVADALAFVRSAADPEGSKRAYDQLLHALGNNHAGTYYPIAVAVIPALKSILESGATWPKVAVLEALTDLTGSFIPELGYDCLPGTNRGTRETLYEAVVGLRDVLESLINIDSSDATRVRQSAKGLLLQLTEIAQDREVP